MNANTLDTIYRKYYKNIYNYIGFRINNHYDVEELTHTVFEKAITNWGRYNPEKPIEPWLITIAKNTVVDYLRKNAHRRHQGLDDVMEFPSDERQPEEILLLDEENRDLMVAMSKLKPKERQILSLRFATDLKYDEIARIMGITSANVRIITHRALKKLRAELETQNV